MRVVDSWLKSVPILAEEDGTFMGKVCDISIGIIHTKLNNNSNQFSWIECDGMNTQRMNNVSSAHSW